MNVTSIEKHLEAINQLVETPLSERDDIQRHLNFITSFPILTFKIPSGTQVYRSSTSFKNEYFNTVSRVSFPPRNKVTEFGRANVPFQPIFYCSEDQSTSYIELINYWVKNITLGQFFYVTMTEWETTDDIESVVVAPPINEHRKSRFEIFSGNAYDHYKQYFDTKQREISSLFYGRLADWYSRPARVGNNIYVVTSSLTNKLFLSVKKLGLMKNASICYPSVANLEEGVNFAFEPELVSSGKIRPVRTWRLKLIAKQNENGFFYFNEVQREYGRIVAGTLKWN